MKFACAAFDVTYRIEKVGQAYTMNPSPELADLLEVCACETVGEKGVGRYSEKGGSEDFTVMMDRVQKLGGKAAHFYYGADSTCNHRSHPSQRRKRLLISCEGHSLRDLVSGTSSDIFGSIRKDASGPCR